MRSWWIAWNSEMRWVFFQVTGFLELIRAEMIIQAVWAWRPVRLQSIHITILFLAGDNCWMLWTYHSACRVNTFICGDSSKHFSLMHDWEVLLLDVYDWLLAETDDAFEILTVECCTSCTTESKEPLDSQLLAFALSGWLTAKNLSLGLLQK